MLVFRFNQVSGTLEVSGTAASMEDRRGYFRPPVDITWCEGIFTIKMDLPGAVKDDLTIQASEKLITIHGEIKSPAMKGPCRLMERPTGEFLRSLSFPVEIVPDKVTAKLENGVLEINVPSLDHDRDPTRIEIRFEGR